MEDIIINYHTHTYRCGHAEGRDREYVEAAIKAGYKILGFSDHCPWKYPNDYVSGIRMDLSQIEGYFDTLTGLKNEYKNDIKIYIGYETEHVPELIEMQDEILKDYPCDYMIQGQHFIGAEYDSFYMGNETCDEDVLRDYVDVCIEGQKSGRYLYLAHPDLINYVGPKDIYIKHMQRLVDFLKENDIPSEFNILGFIQGRHYPNELYLDLVEKAGLKMILGVDAHSPELMGDKKIVKKALKKLKGRGLKIINEDIMK